MEDVAEHINEMQKIYEEYGAIFDELSKLFKETYNHKPVSVVIKYIKWAMLDGNYTEMMLHELSVWIEIIKHFG